MSPVERTQSNEMGRRRPGKARQPPGPSAVTALTCHSNASTATGQRLASDAEVATTDDLAEPAAGSSIDLDNYIPAYLTWIANKLSRGASQAYLATFGIGIEAWRLLVLLTIHGSISPQLVSRVIGMDKASISRTFKSMQNRGYVRICLDDSDGRLRIATITARGRKLHDWALGIALERERALLEVLSDAERTTLVGLLRRLHENLPAVEEATTRYLATHFAQPRRRRDAQANQDSDE